MDQQNDKEFMQEPFTMDEHKRLVAIDKLQRMMVENMAYAIDAATRQYIEETKESIDAHVQLSAIVSAHNVIISTYLESCGIMSVPFSVVSAEKIRESETIIEMDKQFPEEPRA